MRTISLVRPLFFALLLLAVSEVTRAQVGIGISVGFAPPPLPVYEQPICPREGLLWTPGYWAWDPDGGDYYWVPGTWVEAPVVGFFWTPGYWAWGGGAFFFHEGYWGPHVGWYGGINYGFGYFGRGYEGGRWDHDHFYYNRAVNNVNITEIHNVYNTTIINRNENRVSYNGGHGGINERASAEEDAYSRERHMAPVAAQDQHIQEARQNRELRASVNQGKPPIAATERPGSFRGSAVVPAKEAGGRYEPPVNRGANNNPNRPPNAGNNANRPPTHASEITPHDRPASPNTGNPTLDQKYQQQQEKLYAKQEQEHQKMQQKQEQDHQRLAQQNANDARRQQVEQQHQQQTQQMEQRHTQQQEHIQQRQQPQHPSGSGGKPGHP